MRKCISGGKLLSIYIWLSFFGFLFRFACPFNALASKQGIDDHRARAGPNQLCFRVLIFTHAQKNKSFISAIKIKMASSSKDHHHHSAIQEVVDFEFIMESPDGLGSAKSVKIEFDPSKFGRHYHSEGVEEKINEEWQRIRRTNARIFNSKHRFLFSNYPHRLSLKPLYI